MDETSIQVVIYDLSTSTFKRGVRVDIKRVFAIVFKGNMWEAEFEPGRIFI